MTWCSKLFNKVSPQKGDDETATSTTANATVKSKVDKILGPVLWLSIFAGSSLMRISKQSLKFSWLGAVTTTIMFINCCKEVIEFALNFFTEHTLRSSCEEIDSKTTTCGISAKTSKNGINLMGPLLWVIAGFFSRINTLIYMKKYLPMILKEININDAILHMQDNVYRKEVLLVIVWLLILLILKVLTCIYSFYLIAISQKMSQYTEFNYIFDQILIFGTSCADFQFVVLNYLIRTRVTLLHDILDCFTMSLEIITRNQRRWVGNGDVSSRKYLKEKVKRINRMCKAYYLKVDPKGKLVLQHGDGECSVLKGFTSIRRCCKHLRDAGFLVNQLYKFHMLGSISSCIMNTCSNLYSAMYMNSSDKGMVASHLAQIVYYCTRFLAVNVSAGLATIATNDMKFVIWRLFNQYSDLKQYNEESLVELSTLLGTSTHNRLIFTACEFFSLDLPFIANTVYLSSSYFVILAQYEQNEL